MDKVALIQLLLVISLSILTIQSAEATHVVAGEITYAQTGTHTIRLTITTYTSSHSPVNRDSLEVDWGDGSTEIIARENGNGTPLENDVIKNIYIGIHTYPRTGTYTVGMTDFHRNGGILNVNYPNSIRVAFHLSTIVFILDEYIIGVNHSPVLLQPPVDIGCVNQPYIHNPNAYDIDGDKITYEWITPLQAKNKPVPKYLSPDQIEPGPDNEITLNEETGEIVWNSPKKAGQYNIAIRINEYRCGELISSIVRDMSIIIVECIDSPPEITAIEVVCTPAGSLIDVPVVVDDMERINQDVRLSVSGGPLVQDVSPAIFPSGDAFEVVPRTVDFIWQTHCDHIRRDAYNVVIKATDNFFTDSSGLSKLKTLKVQVIGPPPENPEIHQFPDHNLISWQQAYNCSKSRDFQGYTIWRKQGYSTIPDGSCLPDLKDYGFSIVGFSEGPLSNEFIDSTIQDDILYCYRITARYDNLSSDSLICSSVESTPSAEICTSIDSLLPLLTRASVTSTDLSDGSIAVEWRRPEINDDSIPFDGPYTMTLFSTNIATGEFIPLDYKVTAPSLDQLESKYNFTHHLINTVDEQYYYKVQLTTANSEIGFSIVGSSVYLTVEPGDAQVDLNWNSVTPWENFNYVVFRNESGQWKELGQTKETSFHDPNLENGKKYCYRIESVGLFPKNNYSDTTYNFSQEVCAIPHKPRKPCKPILSARQNCRDYTDPQTLSTTLSYSLPESCPDQLSEMKVVIWFRSVNSFTFENIIGDPDFSIVNNGQAIHKSKTGSGGCYQIQLIDQYGQESLLSDVNCVNACIAYKLPNAFSPNGDNVNDIFRPVKNVAVDRVNFEVFDRWGNLVFQTFDPQLNWKGTTMMGQDLEPTLLTYKCDLFKSTEEGILFYDTLSGTIALVK